MNNKDRKIHSLRHALPFWLSLLLVCFPVIAAIYGGWTLALTPLFVWHIFTVLDGITGINSENNDPDTPNSDLFWYRLITIIWVPVQFILIIGLVYYVSRADHLQTWEKFFVMVDLGIISGTIGIVYAHELFHQKNKFERRAGDLLLAMVLYSHFRSEHLLVHHTYVGTPKDAVTARYNEGFYQYFIRVLKHCLASSFIAEKKLLARKKLPWYHASNPFWSYAAFQIIMFFAVFIAGGSTGIMLFAMQAFIAILSLEVTNYVEHYGLTRKHLGDGKYEHVKPYHSWNASHKASNWLLINLQRHSDHHFKPDRRFPLLQTYSVDEAPQLPFGYPLMATAALFPPLWRRWMNPKVREWRAQFYPDITDWTPYKDGTNPLPR